MDRFHQPVSLVERQRGVDLDDTEDVRRGRHQPHGRLPLYLQHHHVALHADGGCHAAGRVAIVAGVLGQHRWIDGEGWRRLRRQLVERCLDERRERLALHGAGKRECRLQRLSGHFPRDRRFDERLLIRLHAPREHRVALGPVLQQEDGHVHMTVGDGHLRGASSIERVLRVHVSASRNEQLDGLEPSTAGREDQCRHVVSRRGVDVGAFGQCRRDAQRVAVPSRLPQRLVGLENPVRAAMRGTPGQCSRCEERLHA